MGSFMNLPNEPPVPLGPDGSSIDDTSSMGRYPLFTRISIETLSFCNRSCTFCPLHWSQAERGRERMSDALYSKIVTELGELHFSGVAQMFLLSEPTIDRSMVDKLRMLRAACPRVTTYASSNGDVFDSIMKRSADGLEQAIERVMQFFDAGLTTLNINIYDEGPDQAERYQRLYQALTDAGVQPAENKYRKQPSPAKRHYVALTDMRLEQNGNQGLTNTLYIKTKEERQTIVAPQKHCARTQRHIVVEWNGNVPICCAIDVTDKSLPPMGNINTQSLLEVWNGEPMNRYRWFTQQKQRVLPGCSTCTHEMAFPAIVRKVEPPAEVQQRWKEAL